LWRAAQQDNGLMFVQGEPSNGRDSFSVVALSRARIARDLA
jgi:hypothetical protein